MQHDALLNTAIELLSVRRGLPPQANLRRAVSTIYYAMFHCLARCCADMLVGGNSAGRSKPAWRQVYRALEHGTAKDRCKNKNILSTFPDDIQDFASIFVWSQEKRQLADYDPGLRQFSQVEVMLDVLFVHDAIKRFQEASIKDRRAFAVFVLFKNRSNPQIPSIGSFPRIAL